jgi:hypothetical protein
MRRIHVSFTKKSKRLCKRTTMTTGARRTSTATTRMGSGIAWTSMGESATNPLKGGIPQYTKENFNHGVCRITLVRGTIPKTKKGNSRFNCGCRAFLAFIPCVRWEIIFRPCFPEKPLDFVMGEIPHRATNGGFCGGARRIWTLISPPPAGKRGVNLCMEAGGAACIFGSASWGQPLRRVSAGRDLPPENQPIHSPIN